MNYKNTKYLFVLTVVAPLSLESPSKVKPCAKCTFVRNGNTVSTLLN